MGTVKTEVIENTISKVEWTPLLSGKQGSCKFDLKNLVEPDMELVCSYSMCHPSSDSPSSCSSCKSNSEGDLEQVSKMFKIVLCLKVTKRLFANSTNPHSWPKSVWASVAGSRWMALTLVKTVETTDSSTMGKWESDDFHIFSCPIRDSSFKCRVMRNKEIFEAYCVVWLEFQRIPEPGPKIVLKQLSEMFTQQRNCTVKFLFKYGKSIGGHVSILAARSSVFAAMFQHPIQASSEIVKIKDIQLDIFKELLHYIYTGQIHSKLTVTKAQSLILAADKYQIDDLKKTCSSFLLQCICMESEYLS